MIQATSRQIRQIMQVCGKGKSIDSEGLIATMDEASTCRGTSQGIILSWVQARPILECREAVGRSLSVSPDLGLTSVPVTVEGGGAAFPGGPVLPWKVLEEICASENNCFLVGEGEPRKVMAYSELTNRVYTLMPTRRAPTLLVSGFSMHRIKGTTPDEDTQEKVKALRPLIGPVLDTTTGLGYTAIEAAKTAEAIITVELDPAVLEIAGLNPWSAALFDNPRITQRTGDSGEVVREFEDGVFARIIHDPPTLALAGHLYGASFYRELLRVLRGGGRLFHYVGNPRSRSGRTVTAGVVERLKEAGFDRVQRLERTFAVVAFK